MPGNRARRPWPVLTMVTGVLALAASDAHAQLADVAGTWSMEVTTQTGTTHPSMIVEQHDDHLMGHYSSDTLGEADFEGSVSGSEIRISFEVSLQGQAVPVSYVGTVGPDGMMRGTIDVAGGLATGTFTATRSSR